MPYRIVTATAAILLAIALLAAPVSANDVLKGSWKAVTVKCSGAVCEAAKELRCEFTDDSIIARYGENKVSAAYQLHRKEDTDQVSVKIGGLVAWKGIYKIEGDRATLCVVAAGGELPDELVTREGDGRVLVELEREED